MLGSRRARELQAARDRNIQVVAENVRQYVAGAPKTYPDGTPFPAPVAVEALGRTALQVSEIDHPDRAAIIGWLHWMMAQFREVAETEPTTDTVQAFFETRMWLQKQGFAEANGVVVQAGLDLMKFWEQNGAQDRMIKAAMNRPGQGQ